MLFVARPMLIEAKLYNTQLREPGTSLCSPVVA